MEIAGAQKIFSRSVERYGIRYTTVISDGHSETVSTLNGVKVYDVEIVKHECVGHIQKRVTTLLKKVKADAAALMRDARVKIKEAHNTLVDMKKKLSGSITVHR